MDAGRAQTLAKLEANFRALTIALNPNHPGLGLGHGAVELSRVAHRLTIDLINDVASTEAHARRHAAAI